MKRLLDFLAASLGLLLLSPVMLLLTVMIRQQLGTPVLFRQIRPGLRGRPFELCKFRSMSDARDEKGDLLPDAERLGSFGRLLRRSSLDELPQLWNVLKGDMSLVGPRPLLMEYLPLYSKEQARRHEVRPGITGWAQVNGRNAISWEERLALDVWYVDHRSLWLDLKILGMTMSRVFRRSGISQPGHETMPKFCGSPTRADQNPPEAHDSLQDGRS
jgi:lipopolysaccharide/colanic/teichoic acid biosynthesis glycosyltransferase